MAKNEITQPTIPGVKTEQVQPPVVSEQPAPTSDPVPTSDPAAPVAKFKDNIPSNWIITPLKGSQVEARNLKSLETFIGTVAEFNQALRG